MPTGTIPIETYTVRVGRNRLIPFARIEISGPRLAHGIQNRAALYFAPTYNNLFGLVRNVGGLNFNGISVFAQIPIEDFDRMYDELRNEAPLNLYYTYGTSETTTKPLNFVAFDSGNEPPGEGSEDEDALEALFQELAT